MALAKRIDAVLASYYEFRNTEGYYDEDGLGKFGEWVEDNGYDTDMIEDELAGDAADCSLFEYDEDFPTHLKGVLRSEFMFDLFKRCKENVLRASSWNRIIGGYFIFKYKAKLVLMNPHEFALVAAEDIIDKNYAVGAKRHYMQQIWIYNHKKNEWRHSRGFDSWTFQHGSICYNEPDDEYWIIADDIIQIVDHKGSVYKQLVLNHASKFITQLNPIEDEKELRRLARYKFWYSQSVYEPARLRSHCLGGLGNASHVKYKHKKKELKWDVSFPALGWERGNTGLGLLYIKSCNRLFAFGGNKWPAVDMPDEIHSEIQAYDLVRNGRHWLKMRTTMPCDMDDFGYASDWNERYIIISHKVYGIWRLDLEALGWDNRIRWEKSKIMPPTDAYHNIAVLGGNGARNYKVLTYGFVRETFQRRFVRRIRTDVYNLIVDYLEEEEFVHCVAVQFGDHWRHMALAAVLKQQLVLSHNQALEQLEREYTAHIAKLLAQKQSIVESIQQQCYQQVALIDNFNDKFIEQNPLVLVALLFGLNQISNNSQTLITNEPVLKSEPSKPRMAMTQNENNINYQAKNEKKLHYVKMKDDPKCYICDKTFSTNTSLRRHSYIHTGERPYKCSECEKGFKSKSALTIHFRGHTGERPYKCSVCEKAFKTSSDLKKHFRIHTGEKPYQCNKCKRRFSQNSHCNRHVRRCYNT